MGRVHKANFYAIIMKLTHQFWRKFVSNISIFLGSKAFRRFIRGWRLFAICGQTSRCGRSGSPISWCHWSGLLPRFRPAWSEKVSWVVKFLAGITLLVLIGLHLLHRCWKSPKQMKKLPWLLPCIFHIEMP